MRLTEAEKLASDGMMVKGGGRLKHMFDSKAYTVRMSTF